MYTDANAILRWLKVMTATKAAQELESGVELELLGRYSCRCGKFTPDATKRQPANEFLYE
uniref:Uncharacterized protein n=1 Tax=Hyaloperonospora arabidopsidis (strain Emoy2) TaxID=559515 RepID=M4BM63_HYAAE